MIYGYCRISTPKQSLERQVRNISHEFPEAIILKEVYTGRKTEGRTEWNKLYKKIKSGDTIVFDSVSRMSRNADEGYLLYEELFDRNINLIFLKEPYVNTTTYKKSLENTIPKTGTKVDILLDAIQLYLKELAKEQVKLAFEQSEKEVEDLRRRTAEGIEIARLNGKQIGAQKGRTVITNKSLKTKKEILNLSKDFNGQLKDSQIIKILGVSRNTYYKYKKELKESGY